MAFALALCACSGPPSEASREAALESLVRAVNRNDVEAALAHYTPDAEFLIPGQHPIRGTEAMRDLLQWDSVLDSRIRFRTDRWRGDTLVAGVGVERNAWFAGVGLDSIVYAAGTRFVFDGEKISGIYPSTLSAKSMSEFEPKYRAFFEWGEANAPEVARLAPGGQFVYTGAAAEEWREVLARYAEARRTPEP